MRGTDGRTLPHNLFSSTDKPCCKGKYVPGGAYFYRNPFMHVFAFLADKLHVKPSGTKDGFGAIRYVLCEETPLRISKSSALSINVVRNRIINIPYVTFTEILNLTLLFYCLCILTSNSIHKL
jgi:hypothetical protein